MTEFTHRERTLIVLALRMAAEQFAKHAITARETADRDAPEPGPQRHGYYRVAGQFLRQRDEATALADRIENA